MNKTMTKRVVEQLLREYYRENPPIYSPKLFLKLKNLKDRKTNAILNRCNRRR